MSTASKVRRTMMRVWEWSPREQRIVQDMKRWLISLQRVVEAKGAKLPPKARTKPRPPASKFKPPPDCPRTEKALLAQFAKLDPRPPKKRRRGGA